MEPKFTPIDLKAWPRTQEYEFFSKIVPLSCSLSVDLDVTKMRANLREQKIVFFPAFVWVMTKSLNNLIEFRTTDNDGVTGYWDFLNPMYPVLHDDDKSISMIWTEYDDSFKIFYDRFNKNTEKYGSVHGFFAQTDNMPPPNCYPITHLPWMDFKHFAFHLDVNRPHLPSFAVGKVTEKNGKFNMPFSVNSAHSFTDGWHINHFLENLQDNMDNPETFKL